MASLSWKEWLQQGQQYENAGRGKNGKPSRFSPTIVYNLHAMALESYCMAILDHQQTLPDNHTFSDLVDALEKTVGLDAELKKRILALEEQQQICAFADMKIAQVDENTIAEFNEVIRIVGDMARKCCHD